MAYRSRRWRGVYVPRLLALGTTPVDWNGYLGQQRRWVRALFDLKFRTLPSLAPKLSPLERLLNLFHGIHYLRPFVFPVLILMLIGMLLRNAVPAFLSARSLITVGALLAILILVDRFRERFALDPAREKGFHWRALILSLAKWPVLLVSLLDAVLGRRKPYQTTPKTGTPSGVARRWVLAPAQVGVALAVSISVAAGVARHGALETELWVAAALVIGTSLILAWTDTWRYPPPYDPRLLDERLADLATTRDPRRTD